MKHRVNPIFRQKKEELKARRRRARLRKAVTALGAALLVCAVVGTYLNSSHWFASDEDEELQFAADAEDIPTGDGVYIPAMVDLAGDPMWIGVAQSEGPSKVRALTRPANLIDPGVSPEIAMLSDTMVSASERFMATIPSTQADFAFFQAQRTAMPMQALVSMPGPPRISPSTGSPLPEEATGDVAAGWGETIGSGEAELPGFRKTAIENNTSVATVSPESERFLSTEDIFVKVLASRTLESVALEGHFPPEDAKEADTAMKALFGREELEAGFVVALRGLRASRGGSLRVMQVSIYANDVFVGTLARNDAGRFVSGADPWVRDDLFNYSGELPPGVKRQYRLLDAIYSTAARNNVPTAVIGEAIMHLSRRQDLNAFATETDRLTLLYSQTSRGNGGAGGRVLYVGVQGAEKSLECFVFRQSDEDYACVSGNDLVRSVALANGMATPVSGVMTSTFGPRRHPILNTVRVHKGIDWVAPLGTPVSAAFDGKIAFVGDGGDYGNLIRISHGGGRETRYAHLSRFAERLEVGAAVKAGDMIGYVGTTGLSTGPHLHFELYQGSEAVDPLETTAVAATFDHTAVEILTDRIVRVESGGNSRAKNPLSSATGLGQFIASTWIRMMNTYRPDLARSLSREDLLALRFDPTISREMVRNLAREGEAYLRARGHQITPGRLYLSHFLGAEGANLVLSSPGDTPLVNVLGSGVIGANPFLTGKDANYVIGWAERKMRGKGYPYSAVREVRQNSPEFEQYKAAITALLRGPDPVL